MIALAKYDQMKRRGRYKKQNWGPIIVQEGVEFRAEELFQLCPVPP